MKISKAEWNNYIKTMSQLSDKASKEFSEWANKNGGWRSIDRQLLAEVAWSIASKYAEGSSALAAEMYDSIALAENKNVPSAELSAEVEFGQLAKAVNGALKNSDNDNYVSAPVGRAVKQAGADTVLKNASRDGAEFAWIPSGDTCPFCLVIASNGWRRASKKNTNGGHAEHIHTNCNCQYAIRFNKNTQYEGFDPEVYQKMYYDADGSNSKEKLKSLQSAYYQANKEEINARKRENYALNKKKEAEIAKNNGKLIRIPQIPASTISEKVKNGEISLRLTYNSYNKHNEGTPEYERYKNSREKEGLNPQSVLTISMEEAQKIIYNQSGTGIIKVRNDGSATNIEQITCDKVIGYYYDKHIKYPTNKAAIHHGSKGSHLVPIKGNNYD